MKLYILIILCLTGSIGWSQKTGNPCPDEGICPFYKVQLKNNFEIEIGDTVNNQRTIRLTGNGIDTIIRSVKLKAPGADLGWLAADEKDFFVLYSTYSGNYVRPQPISIYVFQKETGKLILTGPFIDYDSIKNTILFIDFKEDEKLGLFDMNTMKTEFFRPVSTGCESWWWCIKSNEVTEDQVTIDYREGNLYTRRMIYYR